MKLEMLDTVLADLGQGPSAQREVEIAGSDPVLHTRFRIGEAAATVLAAIGVIVSDLRSSVLVQRRALG